MRNVRIQRASKQIWKFELSPRRGPHAVLVRVSVAPTPSAFGETGQGNGVRGSAYCSACLRTADYDRHECQVLIEYWSKYTGWQILVFLNTQRFRTERNWESVIHEKLSCKKLYSSICIRFVKTLEQNIVHSSVFSELYLICIKKIHTISEGSE